MKCPNTRGFVLLSTFALYSNSENTVSSKKCGIALFYRLSRQTRIFCNTFFTKSVFGRFRP
ncbi:hypothetical protein CYK00_04190 [Neisseria sicca]|uniref:Uncharacterized protein n=2 Tax=Neisseria TaxID=482 RepID=A0A1V0HFQ4_NEISI|nr:hypothetical protein A6J88_11065 [Neisseria mucosa]AVR78837.1 hypothetical protein NM96_05360 [Neisseria mucosa]PLA40770.1 hypothetical protein CYK00_04190 [Neisseria sicca]RKV69947.1 MAG: hypothetical protein D8H97_34305 [Neisseria sp.]